MEAASRSWLNASLASLPPSFSRKLSVFISRKALSKRLICRSSTLSRQKPWATTGEMDSLDERKEKTGASLLGTGATLVVTSALLTSSNKKLLVTGASLLGARGRH